MDRDLVIFNKVNDVKDLFSCSGHGTSCFSMAVMGHRISGQSAAFRKNPGTCDSRLRGGGGK